MAIKSDKAIKISQKHLLGIQDLSINDVNLILDEAHGFTLYENNVELYTKMQTFFKEHLAK